MSKIIRTKKPRYIEMVLCKLIDLFINIVVKPYRFIRNKILQVILSPAEFTGYINNKIVRNDKTKQILRLFKILKLISKHYQMDVNQFSAAKAYVKVTNGKWKMDDLHRLNLYITNSHSPMAIHQLVLEDNDVSPGKILFFGKFEYQEKQNAYSEV